MDQVILAIQALLKANLGATYKKYIYAHAFDTLPKHLLPCVTIVGKQENVEIKGTGGLANAHYIIEIIVWVALKDYMKESTDVDIVEHKQKLIQLTGQRAADNSYSATSIIGVLRDNLYLSETADIVSSIETRYDVIEGRDSQIAQSITTIEVRKLIPNTC